LAAVVDGGEGAREGLREAFCPMAIMLQQIKRHALR